MDCEILVHVLATFFDVLLPPPMATAAPAAAPAGSGTGGGLFGGPALGSSFGGGLGSSSFGLMGAPAGAAKPADKTSVFWRAQAELVGFSSRHLAKATDVHRVKSDVVLLHQPHAGGEGAASSSEMGPLSPLGGGTVRAPADGAAGSGHGSKRSRLRYSLLCDGVEWVVAQGEHNAWEAIVLFLLQRAKRGGCLGGIDLRHELLSSFMRAMANEETGAPPRPSVPQAGHGILSVLHPWSQRLEELNLDEVLSALA